MDKQHKKYGPDDQILRFYLKAVTVKGSSVVLK